MIEKKISRRGFIKGLAVCAAAIPFVPEIITASPPSMVVAEVSRIDKMYPPRRTVRVGIPKVQWRKLNEGVKPALSRNEILDDLAWEKA